MVMALLSIKRSYLRTEKRVSNMAFQPLILLLLLGVVMGEAQVLPGCQDRCGNISIPYPFGTTKNCYKAEEFLITCNESYNPPKAYIGRGVEVIDISPGGELRVWAKVGQICYDETGNWTDYSFPWFTLSPSFAFSYTRNMFTAVGCDTLALFEGFEEHIYASGCVSLCNSFDNGSDGSCSGLGCCQVPIQPGLWKYNLTIQSFNNHTGIVNFNPCSYAFVAEKTSFEFSPLDLHNLRNVTAFPLVLDWVIDTKTCEEAVRNQSLACELNSHCYNSTNRLGYRCNCSEGFKGSPYLTGGCVDVNECGDSSLNDCEHICHNIIGGYTCSCREGYTGDGKGEQGCIANPIHEKTERFPVTKVLAGIGISILLSVAGCFWLYWIIKKRNLIKLRENNFRQNGGPKLLEQLSNRDGSVENAKIFTIEELKKATNDFDESRIVGRGGYGTVYRGILPKNVVVAIKKSIAVDQSQIEQFVNEVIVLSQINHRNVVRLLGCCLETEVPLLVYEFITNGTLFHHIHEVGNASLIAWEVRLRIAAETAGALAYLHSAASTPIIHRDVKTTNILLDDNFTAKVSDFGASRLVPLDKTQLTTLVQGTLGYLDPEYFHSSQLTAKSDVYSFGVVLVELLTGKMALSFDRPEKERNLATSFIASMKENRLTQILADQILSEETAEQVREVANLAQSCLRLNGDERPSMKEVAMELEGLRGFGKHHWIGVEVNSEETEHLFGKSLDFCSTSNTAGYDSLCKQPISPLNIDGR